jgi:hypothetical protein
MRSRWSARSRRSRRCADCSASNSTRAPSCERESSSPAGYARRASTSTTRAAPAGSARPRTESSTRNCACRATRVYGSPTPRSSRASSRPTHRRSRSSSPSGAPISCFGAARLGSVRPDSPAADPLKHCGLLHKTTRSPAATQRYRASAFSDDSAIDHVTAERRKVSGRRRRKAHPNVEKIRTVPA